MMLENFVSRVTAGQAVDFQETMSIIAEHYHYQPTAFSNGLQQPLLNAAGQNEGSCKIFAFAQLQGFNQEQTLALFGDFYRQDVLAHPDANDHQNIRRFMQDGWDGIHYNGVALQAK